MTILTKQELRQKILDLIHQQKEEDSFQKSRLILNKLMALPEFQKARTILFYVSVHGEVDTFPMMDRAMALNKTVVVPFVSRKENRIIPIMIASTKELHKGTYGIPEPPYMEERVTDPSMLDLVLVPGIAFDHFNNRLGRGAGYYDRFLSTLPSTTPTVGLAYDIQVVDKVHPEGHDRPVTLVLTN